MFKSYNMAKHNQEKLSGILHIPLFRPIIRVSYHKKIEKKIIAQVMKY